MLGQITLHSFWGIGIDGLGTNMTGEILMKIRCELQADG